MTSVALRRAAQRPLTRHVPSLRRSIASTSARHEIKSSLYESETVRIPHQNPSLAYFNKGIGLRGQRFNIAGAINFWNESVTSGTKPDGNSYIELLKVLAGGRFFEQCVKVFDDMVAMGVGDKLKALNLVMLSATENLSHVDQAYDLFSAHYIKPDVKTYQHHLIYLDRTDNLERAIQLLREMDDKGVPANEACMRTVILMAARLNMPKLAMELCINAGNALGRLDDEVYMVVLISAAATMNWKVTTWAYDTLMITNPSITLTEPLCIDILNLASRQGHPTLARSILDYLVRERVKVQEHHLTPLINACCNSPRKDRLREAFLALDKFKEYGLEILQENHSTGVLVDRLGKDTESLDEAYDVLLQLPRPVNVEAINAVLQAAAITLSDLPRAIGFYKELETLECEPNTQTYDILLAGCLKAQHKSLGDKLFSDMLSKNLKPSSQTFTRLILLALTQEQYESAFERLEQMKEARMTPPLNVYETLVKRLVKENDPRADLALEDMEVCGYRVGPGLRKFLLGADKKEEGKRDLLDKEGSERRQNWTKKSQPGTRRVART